MERIIKHVVEKKSRHKQMGAWYIKNTKTKFLAEILASRANECYDNIPEDIQYLIKKLEKM